MGNRNNRELQALITHHCIEIKRLANSDEEYKHENMVLLNKELTHFKGELKDE
jgi:hypothetical protein